MSVYIQEVLGLLKRNKKKKKLDKMRDHFEFGKLYQTSHLNTGAAYNPKMEPFVIKWGDLVCEATEDLTRTQPGSGNLGFVPVYTTPEGSCSWDTLKDSIITQNAIGDTITINNGNLIVEGDATVEGDLQVDQNANVNLQLTAGSANILDLTEDRIVIVGPNGELEDDPNFTMDGITFTALVNVQHGVPVVSPAQPTTNTVINSNIFLNGPVYDSQGNVGGLAQVLVGLADGRVIWSDDDVVEALTYGSLWQGNINNLKQELPIGTVDQILISDGVTFSWQDNPAAIVGEQCAVYTIPLWTPDSNTLGCSKLIQDGDNSTPATNVISSVTFNVINTAADSVINLVNDDNNQINFFTPGNNVYGIEAEANGSDTRVKIEHFTSEDANLTKEEFISLDLDTTQTNNKLVLAGDAAGGVHPRLADGSVQVNIDLELEDVPDDNALEKVLVRDTTTGLVRQRDASTIKPQVGFDTLDMLPDGWASTDGNFNAYVNLDDTTTPVKNIKDMDWLVDGDRVVVIAENIKTGSLLADNAIQFPTWGSPTQVQNFASWNSPTTPAGPNLGYPTSELRFGDKVKFTAEMYDQPSSDRQMNWCSCIVFANNQCPLAVSDSYTIQEDGAPLTATAQASDDGYGGYGLTYSLVGSAPGNGTFTFDTATGAFTYDPDPNYFGVEQFQFRVYDGYCFSNTATITINITAVNDSPEWTSTNPVTANTYPNLTAGDQWDYAWTTADPDTPCADLTYVITVEDVTTGTVYTLPDANQWLTFTPDPSNNCAGTLSGQYPATGGAWTVNMTVSDNGNPVLSDTDIFTIAGIVPTVDTYFVNWFDGSGSMDGAGTILSRASSIGYVRASNPTPVSNSTNVQLNGGIPAGGSSGEGQFANDMTDTTAAYLPYKAPLLIVDGMELFVMDPATGNETSTGAFVTGQPVSTVPNNTITLTAPVSLVANTPLVFRRTAAQKKADYNGGSVANTRLTARSFLQDFYATGLTEAQEDAQGVANNPATNGSDEYDNKVKFGWIGNPNSEHTIKFLANSGNGPLTTNPGDQFENADTVVFAAWGDESNDYMNGLDYQSPTSTAASQLVASDIANLQSYIQAAETAAGNNQIYRAVHVAVGNANPNIADLVQGLVVGTGGAAPTFGGTWTNNNLMPVPLNTAPIKYVAAGYTNDPIHGVITGVGNQTDLFFAAQGQTGTAAEVQQNGQYYMSIYRERLLALGFVGI